MDGHTTHTKNLAVIKLVRENGIVLLCLPAHTIHRLQPCDVSFFRPLSLYYNQSADTWLNAHPNQNITQFQVAQLLGEAYAKVAILGNAVSGFKKTGIWPLDRTVFQDCDFITSSLQNVREPDFETCGKQTNEICKETVDNLKDGSSSAACSTSPRQERRVPVSQISLIPVLQKKSRSGASSSTIVIAKSPYKKN